MRFHVALLMIVVGALVGPLPAFAQDKPANIPVVKTWEDLLAVPAINLEGGVKVRLGLAADKAPQWSPALLYCLAEGHVLPTGGKGHAPLGPVHADFRFEKDLPLLQDLMQWESDPKKPKGTHLFVRPHSISRVGTYRVEVTDPGKRVLARAAVEGTRDFFHPWMPWLDGYREPKTPWEGIALPRVDRFGPIASLEPGKVLKGKLPNPFAGGDEPTLTIRLEGKADKEMIISARAEFTTSRPEQHFLARWWVNGKPFVPKQTDRFVLFAGYGRVVDDKELRVPFNFLPDRLGARPGDTIGLQLLHSECGWEWCSDSQDSVKASLRSTGENLRLSKRIEFEVPK